MPFAYMPIFAAFTGASPADETAALRGVVRAVAAAVRHPVERSSGLRDALATALPGTALVVQTADCVPILFASSAPHAVVGAVGAVHAGWRGTVKRIVEKGVGAMRLYFNSKPRDLRAAIGPGVHNCCYKVGEEVRENFYSQFEYAASLFHEVKESDPVREKYPLLFLTARAPGHSTLPVNIFLDLVEANRRQLLDAGVVAKNIEVLPFCTSCQPDLLFSYRAENGITGRLMGVVAIRPTDGSKRKN